MTKPLNDFELMKSMDLIVRTHNIILEDNKKQQKYYDKLYDDENKKKLIKYQSKFNNNHNALHVFTGELHGGYIGIDIDCKNNAFSHAGFCIATLDELPRTLTCTTPNRGFHYLFKLTNDQQKALSNYKTRQAELFGYDIDVLYNTGRFVMSGQYSNYNPIDGHYISRYKIIDTTKPAILPNVIFDEIINKYTKPNSTIKSTSIKSSTKNSTDNKNNSVTINPNGKNNIDEILKMYLGCLKPERCDKREPWLRVGVVIFNEGGSFELFNNWSKLSQKYNAKACKKLWDSFDANHESKLTIGTLKKYAKEDDPVQYRTIRQKTKLKKPLDSDIKKSQPILDKIFSGSEYANDKFIADLIFCLYPNKFIYDRKNKYWYSLNKYNIYEEEDKNLYTVREIINTHILSIIEEYGKEKIEEYDGKIAGVKRDIENCDDKDEKKFDRLRKILKRLKKRLKSLDNILRTLIHYLCTALKKDGIIKELAVLCRKKNIYEKLDTINPYLFAFKNGVYDIKNKTFRLPTPEEFICCTCKYKYKPPDQKYVDELEKIFADVFIDPDERRCVLMLLSTGLIGTNILELLVICIGSGANSKGLIMQLLDSTLGGYFGTLDIDYFNSKDNIKSGAANSSLAACKNCRWVNVSEVESNIKLKENRLKQLTGRDKVQARNLYGNSFEYIAKFKLCFQTNEKPIIDGADGAIKRRLRYITFRTKFVDNPTQPNERKIDRDLKDRILLDDGYKYAYFSILLKHFYILSEDEKMVLNMPASFQADVDNFLNENDPVNSFIKDCLNKTANHSDTIRSRDLYDEFKIYSNDKYVSAVKFKTVLEKNDIKSIRGKIGMVYHNLAFKYRPSQNQENKITDVDFID
jgi:P4 family phage/plasmid primase-like protien